MICLSRRPNAHFFSQTVGAIADDGFLDWIGAILNVCVA